MTILHDAAVQLQAVRGGVLTPVFGLLIDTALKGSLLIAAAAIAAYLLRGRSASARHAAWSAAVIGHLALPALTLLAPQWRLPILPTPPWLDTAVVALVSPPAASSVTIDSRQPTSGPTSPALNPAPQSTPAAVTAPPTITLDDRNGLTKPGAKWPMISVLGLLWLLGSLLVLARLAFGTWRVGRLAKEGDRVADGEWLSLAQRLATRLNITRPLTLLRGESLAVPVTWGVVYPAVLLPPDADQWPESRRRFVLVHEMAHVKRFDALTQLLAQFAIAILWFDPLIWLAAHRMRVEREHACDDYVLRDGTAPSLYAGELLEMVQSIGSPRHESAAPAFAALAMARRSEFEGRMLAILDPKQERHTLGRRSAIVATFMLAILVLPLAALRPFQNSGASRSTVASGSTVKSTSATTPLTRLYKDNSCDSLLHTRKGTSMSHIHSDDSADGSVIELLTNEDNTCAQAAIVGKASFLDDRLYSLAPGAYASFQEVTPDADRKVVITSDDGALRYASFDHGKATSYSDEMRAWMGRFVPKVLREVGVDADARVARDRERGGVNAVLRDIAGINSTSSKRMHYEALLRGPALTHAEYDRVARQAGRELASQPSDLDAVLTLISATPTSGVNALERAVGKLAAAQQTMHDALGTALRDNKSSTDSATTFRQYAATDDPQMIVMALQGARDLSSDDDRRLLLQTIAPKAFATKSHALRAAFFDAARSFTSDTDLRLVLQDALTYARKDPEITIGVLGLTEKMSSDTDRRLVLTTAAGQHLISSDRTRAAYMSAAKKITTSSDYRIVLQAILDK